MVFSVGLLCLSSGCQRQKGLPHDALNPSRALEANSRFGSAWSAADFDILSAQIEGDSLQLEVRYGGGCGSHRWAFESAGPMLKSMPPQQAVQIVHETSGDPCRALILEVVTFDLKPFRRSPRGVTVILLENLKLTYAYND